MASRRNRTGVWGGVCAGMLAVALIPGCATGPAMPTPITEADVRRAATQGQAVLVARIVRGDTGAGLSLHPRTPLFFGVSLWNVDTGALVELGLSTPGDEAGQAGWLAQAVPQGRYMMRFNAIDYMLDVPAGAGAIYVGSFDALCHVAAQDRPPSCNPGEVRIEPPGQRPSVPGLGPPREVVPPRIFSLAAAQSGWPSPVAIRLDGDAAAWRAAVDWREFVSREASAASLRASGDAMSIAAEIGSGGRELGVVVASPFIAAAAVALVGSALVASAEEVQIAVTTREGNACTARLGAQISPDSLADGLGPGFATPPREPVTARTPSAATWEATLTRVVLRRCSPPGGTPGHHFGVETATRWRTEGGREARFVQRVDGARNRDPLLTFPVVPAWEAATPGIAECRPIETWCSEAGPGLVRDEVREAVAAARDALLAAR